MIAAVGSTPSAVALTLAADEYRHRALTAGDETTGGPYAAEWAAPSPAASVQPGRAGKCRCAFRRAALEKEGAAGSEKRRDLDRMTHARPRPCFALTHQEFEPRLAAHAHTRAEIESLWEELTGEERLRPTAPALGIGPVIALYLGLLLVVVASISVLTIYWHQLGTWGCWPSQPHTSRGRLSRASCSVDVS